MATISSLRNIQNIACTPLTDARLLRSQVEIAVRSRYTPPRPWVCAVAGVALIVNAG
ncbi:hypothetical protein GCM10007927_27520 [Sulfitobacter pacificus]|uniref:Uncharacterized protein n=1 Tax=Sulfitobacter pacificus TaxID=1499314 RepID=A0ABQ5VLP6_9RHOB|nr:hypothetical protein GCM10007927_27520 [Sulfitobacter pacificus]